MAEPRRVSTRRAVLSYDQLKRLTKENGREWPDLLVKDYQGIIQDFIFTSDEIDDLELRVISLESRVDALEARILRTIKVTESVIAESFQVVLCDNVDPIEITLNPDAVVDDMIHVMRRDAEVTVLGFINGDTDKTITVQYWSQLYIFDGAGWNVI